jgi:hypothetical protein
MCMTTTEDERRVAPEGTPEDPDAIRERGKGPRARTKRGLHTGRPAYLDFAPEMRKLIKDSLLPAEATDADLYYLLEISATYRLDPFARELWAVKMPGRNAAQGAHLTIMVGRDGMLAIAERHPDYRATAARRSTRTTSSSTAPTRADAGRDVLARQHSFTDADRGELLGAWAEVYREGRPPVFFFAPLEEYDKSRQRLLAVAEAADGDDREVRARDGAPARLPDQRPLHRGRDDERDARAEAKEVAAARRRVQLGRGRGREVPPRRPVRRRSGTGTRRRSSGSRSRASTTRAGAT